MQLDPASDPILVRRLAAGERDLYLRHLQDLPEEDRQLRFGHSSIRPIEQYVARIDFGQESVLAALTPEGALLGAAHVAFVDDVAELGVSVTPGARRRRIGSRLAQAGLQAALRAGVAEFQFQFAPYNAGMRRIAERLNMAFEQDGTDLVASRRFRSRDQAHAQ